MTGADICEADKAWPKAVKFNGSTRIVNCLRTWSKPVLSASGSERAVRTAFGRLARNSILIRQDFRTTSTSAGHRKGLIIGRQSPKPARHPDPPMKDIEWRDQALNSGSFLKQKPCESCAATGSNSECTSARVPSHGNIRDAISHKGPEIWPPKITIAFFGHFPNVYTLEFRDLQEHETLMN
jgi:hypothetical protein